MGSRISKELQVHELLYHRDFKQNELIKIPKTIIPHKKDQKHWIKRIMLQKKMIHIQKSLTKRNISSPKNLS